MGAGSSASEQRQTKAKIRALAVVEHSPPDKPKHAAFKSPTTALFDHPSLTAKKKNAAGEEGSAFPETFSLNIVTPRADGNTDTTINEEDKSSMAGDMKTSKYFSVNSESADIASSGAAKTFRASLALSGVASGTSTLGGKSNPMNSKKRETVLQIMKGKGLKNDRTTFRTLARAARMSVRLNGTKKSEEKKKKVMTIVEFEHEYDFDDNGILYYLGTQGYLLEWFNPTKVPLPIVCQRSSDGKPRHLSGSADDIAGHTIVRSSWTEDKPHQWWQIDVGEGRAVRPTKYTLRHGTKLDNAIRTWRFLASNDARHWHNQRVPKTGEKGRGTKGDWVHLHLTFGDRSLDGAYSTATWDVLKLFNGQEHDFYRYFRIEHMGLNEDEGHMLPLSGFELYGELRLDMRAQTEEAHKYKAACMIQNMCRMQMSKSLFGVMRAMAREKFRQQKKVDDAAKKIQVFVRVVQNRTRCRLMFMAKAFAMLKQRSALIITSFFRRYVAWRLANGIASRARIELLAVHVLQRNARIFVARIQMGSIKDVMRAEIAAKKAREVAFIQRREGMHRKREAETAMYIEYHNAVKVIQQAYRDSIWRAAIKTMMQKHMQVVIKDNERDEEKLQYLASDEFRMTRLGKLQLLLDEKLSAEDEAAVEEEDLGLDARYE